jgi:hypothetical protein
MGNYIFKSIIAGYCWGCASFNSRAMGFVPISTYIKSHGLQKCGNIKEDGSRCGMCSTRTEPKLLLFKNVTRIFPAAAASGSISGHGTNTLIPSGICLSVNDVSKLSTIIGFHDLSRRTSKKSCAKLNASESATTCIFTIISLYFLKSSIVWLWSAATRWGLIPARSLSFINRLGLKALAKARFLAANCAASFSNSAVCAAASVAILWSASCCALSPATVRSDACCNLVAASFAREPKIYSPTQPAVITAVAKTRTASSAGGIVLLNRNNAPSSIKTPTATTIVDHSAYFDAVEKVSESSPVSIRYSFYAIEWHRRLFVSIMALAGSLAITIIAFRRK